MVQAALSQDGGAHGTLPEQFLTGGWRFKNPHFSYAIDNIDKFQKLGHCPDVARPYLAFLRKSQLVAFSGTSTQTIGHHYARPTCKGLGA